MSSLNVTQSVFHIIGGMNHFVRVGSSGLNVSRGKCVNLHTTNTHHAAAQGELGMSDISSDHICDTCSFPI